MNEEVKSTSSQSGGRLPQVRTSTTFACWHICTGWQGRQQQQKCWISLNFNQVISKHVEARAQRTLGVCDKVSNPRNFQAFTGNFKLKKTSTLKLITLLCHIPATRSHARSTPSLLKFFFFPLVFFFLLLLLLFPLAWLAVANHLSRTSPPPTGPQWYESGVE